jgi:CRP-like cAMP-binding protein
VIFAQGDPTDFVLLLQDGRVKVSVHSRGGREALLNILGPGEFFGLVGLSRRPARSASTTAITDCAVFRISAKSMWQSLRDDPQFFEYFVSQAAERTARINEYLAEQLLNSTEQRLARSLLRLAEGERSGGLAATVSGFSHEMLAGMVGTTRPRITHFMNKFRRLGMIEYGPDGVQVGAGLREFAQHN